MINWTLLLVVACLLGIYLLYKEGIRPRRAKLLARLIASAVAVSALLWMAYPRPGINAGPQKIFLLTNGFSKDSVNKLVQDNKDVRLFAASEVREPIVNGFTVSPVTDWQLFAAAYPAAVMHVFGTGLEKQVLQTLAPRPIIFHPGPPEPGVAAIYWKQVLSTGEPLVVQGHYINNSPQPIKLAMQIFGSIKDSVLVPAGKEVDFSLQSVPLHTGKAIYSLLAVAGKDTLQTESVPVSVAPARPVKLLIIASAPDFENTYVKNYLSQQGYAVATSTVVSTNLANQQFLNTSIKNNGLLSSSYINQFDVLITDQETLENLGKSVRAVIVAAIQSTGVGLLVKMNTAPQLNDFYSRFFPVKKLSPKKTFILHEAGFDSSRYKINIADPASILYSNGTQPLLYDAQLNVFASAVQYGNGKIIASTLSNTYSMALAGDISDYRRLWSLLLGKAARKIPPSVSWLMDPVIPYCNKPAHLQAVSNGTVLQRVSLGETHVYLAADQGLPFQYNGMYWPMAAGWQPNPLAGDSEQAWYAYNTNDWSSITRQASRQQTERYEKEHLFIQGEKIKALSSTKSFQLLAGLLLFLGSCIFLWVEQKAG